MTLLELFRCYSLFVDYDHKKIQFMAKSIEEKP